MNNAVSFFFRVWNMPNNGKEELLCLTIMLKKIWHQMKLRIL